MSDLVILGTDTDAGKTTFALLWMSAFTRAYDYWKPLETGESDSAKIRRLVPMAKVHPRLLAFAEPVAPLLAARTENVVIPQAVVIAATRPVQDRPLLVESFGGPFSPLNETELQIEFVRALGSPCILVTSGAVGAIGRSIQCINALAAHGIVPLGIVLVGDNDHFAVEQIKHHWRKDEVWCLQAPTAWDAEGVAIAANAGRDVLLAIRDTCGPKHPTRQCGGRAEVDLIERDKKAIWHPYTSLGDATPPLVCVGAQDEFLHLQDGRRIIDAISSWWTILHGHRHPVLMAALADACERFDHVHFAGVTHEPAIELAELMLRSSPWPAGRVFFSDNGSTAVEVALKMAYQFWCHRGEPQRTRFVGFEHGYHGDTFGAMSVGRDPVFFGCFEPFLFQASAVPLSAESLDAELTRHRDKVAAVIVEPLVQAAGGMIMHTPATLHDLAEVAHRHGVLFIADEVMTGGGRTGNLWAHQAARIIPDLICTGKTLAGGVLPLAATLVAPHVVKEFATSDPTQTFFHGHSFTAHPLACAVAVANWKTLLAGPITAATRVEAFWREAFSPLKGLADVRDVRVLGSIVAIELAGEGGYLATVGRHVRDECLKRGVLIRPLGNVVYAMPPLLASNASLEQIADAIKAPIVYSSRSA